MSQKDGMHKRVENLEQDRPKDIRFVEVIECDVAGAVLFRRRIHQMNNGNDVEKVKVKPLICKSF